MNKDYSGKLLNTILNVKVNGKKVWAKRVQHQTQFIHILEEYFSTDIINESFGFYPNKIYFGTPLTSDPKYTQSAKPVWNDMKQCLEKIGWDVYAPFSQTDPHSKIPDMYNSYGIRDLDHVQILTSEVALFDLNRPSHGVGQEIEMSVFLPKIGFSKEKTSRLVKGMPGMMVLQYQNSNHLIDLVKTLFARTDYKTEPFYLDSCPLHPTKSIFKGNTCLQCLFRTSLQTI
jgi:hypothetical protein